MKNLVMIFMIFALATVAFADEELATDKAVEPSIELQKIEELEAEVTRLTKENLEKEVQLRNSLANERWVTNENQMLRKWLLEKRQQEKRIITNKSVEALKKFEEEQKEDK